MATEPPAACATAAGDQRIAVDLARPGIGPRPPGGRLRAPAGPGADRLTLDQRADRVPLASALCRPAFLRPRIRLLVLYGGRSAEHEVSCVSARHVLAAADPNRYDLRVVGITTEGRWVDATGGPRPGSASRGAAVAGPPLPAPDGARSAAVEPVEAVTDAGRRAAGGAAAACTVRWARTARCRVCWRWPASRTAVRGWRARPRPWTRGWPRRC